MQLSLNIPDKIIQQYAKNAFPRNFPCIDLRLHFNEENLTVESVSVAIEDSPYFQNLDFIAQYLDPFTTQKEIVWLRDNKEISVKTAGSLLRAGFRTTDDLKNFPVSRLEHIHNIGEKGVEEIIDYCNNNDIKLQNDYTFPKYVAGEVVMLLTDVEYEDAPGTFAKKGTVLTVMQKIEDGSTCVPIYKCCVNGSRGVPERILCSPGQIATLEEFYKG